MYSIQWTIHKYNYIILGMAQEQPGPEQAPQPGPVPEPPQPVPEPPESEGLSNIMIITIMSVHTIKSR